MHIQSTFRATATTHASGVPSGAIAGLRPASVTFYPADATIYAQGDATGALYVVEFGTVRICCITSDGRRQITGFMTAGDVFGFEADDEHQSSAESVDGAGLRVLHSDESPGTASHLLAMALRGLSRTQHQLMLLGCRSANVRMASFLADLFEQQGGDKVVHLAMQRADIADYLGITFETVSRALRYLKDRRIIRLKSISDIEILDHDALLSICD